MTPSASPSSHLDGKIIAAIVIAALIGLFAIGSTMYLIFRHYYEYGLPYKRRGRAYEDFRIDSPHDYTFKHLSTSSVELGPPTPLKSLPTLYSDTMESFIEMDCISLKEPSSADLESGSGSGSTLPELKKGEEPVPSPSTSTRKPLRISITKAPLSRMNTMKSSDDETSQTRCPDTPYTSFRVETATVVRPQDAHIVPTLPPGVRVLSPRIIRPVSSKSRRYTRARSKHFHALSPTLRVEDIPLPSFTPGHLDLDMRPSTSSSRPSFDSVLTRSVPPPYALLP